MDFHARQYDPQLGRFLGIDPKAYSGGQQVFSPYAAMGNSPGMMIDPNGEMTKLADQAQDDNMNYAGMDALAVRAFMDGVAGGLYNISFMYGSNNMLMAGGGGSSGARNMGGGEWLPRYTDNMNMCNVFRAAVSEVSGMANTISIKNYVVAPDNSIYITYTVGVLTSYEDNAGTDGEALAYKEEVRTVRLGLAPKGDLQRQQDGGRTFDGIKIFERDWMNGGITLPPAGIWIEKHDNNLGLMQHEYGHKLQYDDLGFAKYYITIGIPSIYNTLENYLDKKSKLNLSTPHMYYFSETDANTRAQKHFGPGAPINNWPNNSQTQTGEYNVFIRALLYFAHGASKVKG